MIFLCALDHHISLCRDMASNSWTESVHLFNRLHCCFLRPLLIPLCVGFVRQRYVQGYQKYCYSSKSQVHVTVTE